MPENILRLPAVQVRTGLSRSTIYARIAEGTFPHSIHLGERAVGWLESDINDWIAAPAVRTAAGNYRDQTHCKHLSDHESTTVRSSARTSRTGKVFCMSQP